MRAAAISAIVIGTIAISVTFIGCSDTSSEASDAAPSSDGRPDSVLSDAGGTADGPGPDPTGCVNTPRVITLDETTSLGTARALLDVAGGEHTAELEWQGSQMYATHTRQGTRTALTLRLQHRDDDEARFVDSTGGGCPSGGAAPCIVCSPWLEIDLLLEIATDDGALAESAPATIISQGANTATLELRIAAAAVSGSYLDEVTALEASRAPVAVVINAGYATAVSGSKVTPPDAWNGFVAAIIDDPQTPSPTGGVMQAHGYFPAQ